MNKQLPHPTPDELAAYSRGELTDDNDREIESHLQECDHCCDTLNSLPEDTFFALMRNECGDETGPSASADVPDVNVSERAIPLADHPRYRIIDLIGEGGMGAVYLAEHRMMRRVVAIKLINPRLINRPGAVDRFHREVQAAARLSHPNIVTSYDAEQFGDQHFLVMEFVNGTDLAEIVKQRAPLPTAEACNYICQAAMGLQHAYDQGMVHRDIKPHNLMLECGDESVGTQPVVKILDFGLASLLSEAAENEDSYADGSLPPAESGQLTLAGSMMGTPDFISPEQATDARSADTRSDIYSLGATLYYLLVGQPPFVNGTIHQKLEAHRLYEPPPIQAARPDVSMELAAVTSRMMAKDPGARFATPHEVVQALEPFVVPPPTKAILNRLVPWFITLAALSLCGLATLTMAFYVMKDRATGSSQPLMVRQFRPSDETLSQDGVTRELGGWRIDATRTRTVRLFEVEIGNLDDCTLVYQAKLKTDLGAGQAYLEMLCHLPSGQEAFSRFGRDNPLTGATEWVSVETPMYVQEGQKPDVVKLNVVVKGAGTVWIKDVVLRTKALPNMPFFQDITPGGNPHD